MQLSLNSRQSRDWAPNLVYLIGWSLFAILVWALRWNWLVGVTALPVLIVFTAKAWSPAPAAFFWIFISLVWSQFSLAPMGMIWVVGMGVYLTCRFVIGRFEVTSRFQFALIILGFSLLFDFLQWMFLLWQGMGWSWWYLLRAIWIGVVHGLMGLALSPLYEAREVRS